MAFIFRATSIGDAEVFRGTSTFSSPTQFRPNEFGGNAVFASTTPQPGTYEPKAFAADLSVLTTLLFEAQNTLRDLEASFNIGISLGAGIGPGVVFEGELNLPLAIDFSVAAKQDLIVEMAVETTLDAIIRGRVAGWEAPLPIFTPGWQPELPPKIF